MTCQELIAVLADFLEGTLTDAMVDRFEAHLADCEPCRAYLATYRRTREVAATEGRVEMPGEMKARLRAFLLEQLRRK